MKLKVGHLTIAVQPMSEAEAINENANGFFESVFQRIRVRVSLSPEEQGRVLLHECIHAVYEAHGLTDEKRDEEETCTALDRPLAMLFQDNPELLIVLHEALNKGRPVVTLEGPPAASKGKPVGVPRGKRKGPVGAS